jgi:hypothetical protein
MNSIYKAPIVLFVFNRLHHTKKTIEALKKNQLASESELYIYSDEAKTNQDIHRVKSVRDYIKTVTGFKKIIIVNREYNWGLADSIIDGVTQIVNQYGRVIVLEDDLVTSQYFLKFMNDALEMYSENEEVISIHGYFYPIEGMVDVPETFFIKGADCWGWATWKRGWDLLELDSQKLLKEIDTKGLHEKANFNNTYNYIGMLRDQIKGKNNSWAIRWYLSALLKDKLTLYPKISFVRNIGNEGSGTHHSSSLQFFTKDLSQGVALVDNNNVVSENLEARLHVEIFFRSLNKSFFRKLYNSLKNILN